MTNTNILPIDTGEATLEVVGGKGRSLAEMANAGLAVPGGFYVTTAAYRRFVADNDLQAKIIELAKPTIGEFTLSFDQASEAIQALFQSDSMSEAMAAEITAAYQASRATTRRWRCARRPTPRTCPTCPSRASRTPTSMYGAPRRSSRP